MRKARRVAMPSTSVDDVVHTQVPRPVSVRLLLETLEAIGMQIGNFCVRAVAFDRLRESEERYAQLVELTAVGASHVDVNGHPGRLIPQADASPTNPARAHLSTGSTRRLRRA